MNIKTIVTNYINWMKITPTIYGNTPKEYIECMVNFPLQFKQQYELLTKKLTQKTYAYQVVFTLKDNVLDSEEVIETYIKKQFDKNSPKKILEAYICKEYQENGKAHWHVAVLTTKALNIDRFNYYKQK